MAMDGTSDRLRGVYWLLRVALGVGMVLAGIDKFFDRLATWSMYLAPAAEKLLPVSGAAFLRAAGVLEIAIGAAVLSRFTRAGAYALALWLLAIAVNLAVAGSFWDLVLRDLQNAVAAFALARMAELRAAAPAGALSPGPLAGGAARP